MIFQHYTTDDFKGHEALLNKPFTLENVRATIAYIDPDLELQYQTHDGVKWWSIVTTKFGKDVIFNCTFSEVLFQGGGVHHPEFFDINSWVYSEGLPIIADTYILREDYPALDHIVCDRTAAQELYQLTYGIQ